MKNYILKLSSGTTYKLYDGATLVSDANLTTLFTTAGSAYFSFDFNEGTPSATDELTITNSSDTAVITNTGLTDAIAENKNYKGTWSANATAFDTFSVLGGVAMDESQISNLMGKIKTGPVFEFSDTDISTYGNGSRFQAHKMPFGTLKYTGPSQKTIIISNSGYQTLAADTYLYKYHDSVNPSYWYMFCYNSYRNIVIGRGYNNGVYNNQIVLSPPLNVLTSTSTEEALAANQGKVLNDKIGGDLSNLTTTDKSSLINAINELNTKLGTIETTLNTINNGSGA